MVFLLLHYYNNKCIDNKKHFLMFASKVSHKMFLVKMSNAEDNLPLTCLKIKSGQVKWEWPYVLSLKQNNPTFRICCKANNAKAKCPICISSCSSVNEGWDGLCLSQIIFDQNKKLQIQNLSNDMT